MLATFVIGLREGLEAALIVAIIATFLRKNGRRLTTMWVGVVAAVIICLGVGITLKVVESNLPQRQQEAMATVIGVVAVLFVTGMVLWMSTHARELKKDVESAASSALGSGTSRALVLMAFLAVLKEGFETAVFLLATFQAASNTRSAVIGAALGIGASVLLGVGIYTGGVTINLGKFFTVTSGFLILIAAGLVVTALRTAHGAGWLNAGQGRTVDLHWLAPPGSVRSAVFTGVLGIPADPRLIEVLGWLLYVVPLAAMAYWPRAHRPDAAAKVFLKVVIAFGCLVGAATTFVAVPHAHLTVPAAAPVADAAGVSVGTISLDGSTLRQSTGERATLHAAGDATTAGVRTHHLVATPPAGTTQPTTLTLAEVIAMNGGRPPVGMDPALNPGPYAASWHRQDRIDVWTTHGIVYAASRQSRLTVQLTGGGLRSPRTLTVSSGARLPAGVTAPAPSWTVPSSYSDDISARLNQLVNQQDSAHFWGRVVPAGLVLVAVLLLITAGRDRRDLSQTSRPIHDESSSSRSTAHA